MLNFYTHFDAAPTPEMMAIIGISMGAVIVLCAIIAVSIILIAKAIRKKKAAKENKKQNE
ncbi:MAG: hypothetical protein JXN65_03570 [Clostridia bacterium]|nr:hypothetical protein [Clostridia bacterium]